MYSRKRLLEMATEHNALPDNVYYTFDGHPLCNTCVVDNIEQTLKTRYNPKREGRSSEIEQWYIVGYDPKRLITDQIDCSHCGRKIAGKPRYAQVKIDEFLCPKNE